MRRAGVLTAAVLATGCGDALTSRVDVVARADGYELGVEPLAELIAMGKGLSLQREVAEGVAVLWVDYTVFADRWLRGDSLTDSAHVTAAMWAEIQQEYADRYHEQLVNDGVRLDSAQLDSAYAVGLHRLIKLVLVAVEPTASPDVRSARRRQAEDTHARLRRGALTWAEAAAASEALNMRGPDGSLGVIAHGEQPAAIENVAYALAPGEISAVTEAPGGYVILRRPTLAEARAEFQEELDLRREEEFDTAYLAALPERSEIEIRSGVGPAVRELGQDALRAKESGKVLGTYRGGRFRVSDLARWLQAMPIQVRQQLTSASDSQITQLVTSLIRNQALVEEARDAGVTLTPAFHEEITDQLRRELALVGALLGFPVDSLAALRALPEPERRTLVGARVLAYLHDVAQNRRRLQTVPPFLADTLRTEADWRLVPAGVERVLDRARQIRLSLDSLPPSRPPQPAAPEPGAN